MPGTFLLYRMADNSFDKECLCFDAFHWDRNDFWYIKICQKVVHLLWVPFFCRCSRCLAWNCLATISRSFRQRDAHYHGKNLPPKQAMQSVINNFQQNGTVQDCRKSYIVPRERPVSPRKIVRARKICSQKQVLGIRNGSNITVNQHTYQVCIPCFV